MIATSRLLPVFGLLCLFSTAAAQVRVPAIIGDHMVLQRDSTVPLWGWASPEEEVSLQVPWLPSPLTTKANRNGKWRIDLRTPGAGGPYRLVLSGKNEVPLSDVLIGEVWLCSGQSNMEMPVSDVGPGYRGDRNWEAEIAASELPTMRLFTVENAIATSPKEDCEGAWKVGSPEAARLFSAAGFFFGRKLHHELDVPVGLISADWGGTVAESWTSEETLTRSFPEFADALASVAALRNPKSQAAFDAVAAVKAWWAHFEKADLEQRAGVSWSAPDLDDRSWESLAVPGVWQSADLGNFDGVVWLRHEVALPESFAGQDLVLELGAIDDMDTTWFNGERVGGMERPGEWQTPRTYAVPGKLVRAGRNVLTVRVYDSGGGGGLTANADKVSARLKNDASQALYLAGTWRYRKTLDQRSLKPWPDASRGFHANVPTALFNGMIAPIVPYGIRGAIWYQGESNRPRAMQYRRLFPAMIQDWRAQFGRGDFPFYFVQIAPFRYGGDTGEAAELREAQLLTAQNVANTGIAVTMDIGNPADIHPRKKREVGERLALWALAKTYHQPIEAFSGPLYRAMTEEGSALRIHFEHADSGLRVRGESLTHFEIAGHDGVFRPAKAMIDGETVVVMSDAVPHPVAVRYAWGAADEPNLMNAAGLPASSFRTDDLPRSIVAIPQGEPIDVYVIAGQSNATGQGVVANLEEAQRHTTGALLFHTAGSLRSEWMPMTWRPHGAASESPDRFGPELGFVARMAELRPGRRIAIIKHAKSGSSLHGDWYPGTADGTAAGPEWRRMLAALDDGLGKLRAAGAKPVLRGVLWQQGEADARSDAPEGSATLYGERLKQFITRLRAETRVEDLPFTYGYVLPVPLARFSGRDLVRRGQAAVDQRSGDERSVRGAFVVPTDDLSLRAQEDEANHKGDVVHFGTDGQWKLGVRYAEALAGSR